MKNIYNQTQSKKNNSFFSASWKFTLLIMMLWTSNSFGQLLSENFEGGFPAGWTTTYNTGFPWTLVTNASGYGVGNNSVYIDFYDIVSGSEQLNTIQFTAAPSGYFLVFDEAYASFGNVDDQLQINYSTDGGTTWNQLILLDGGDSGPLNTAGDITTRRFVPEANQWQTLSYAVPVGTNMIQFNGISAFGNNLFVDNVQVIQACSGTPNPGSATSLTSSTCPFANFTVSLSGADNTPGLTYQWQSSSDNIVYNNIAGATLRDLTTNEINSMWYQCIVTCTNSGLSATSSSFQVTINVSALPLLEDFESSSFPADCFSESFNTSFPWSHAGVSAYGVGSYSAKMDFWDLSSGSEQLYTSQFSPTTSGYVLRFDEAYASAFNLDDQLQVLYSTDGGVTFTQLVLLDGGDSGPLNTGGDNSTSPFVPTAGQWQTLSYNLPVGTNMIQFNAISAFGNNLYVDNVHVFVPIPCSGTPVAGTAISFANPVGQNVQFLLALSGADNTDGLTYQWQSSPDNIVYTNIAGATNSTLVTSGTSDTWYQCIVTCSNSGLSSTSVPVLEYEHLAFTWTPVTNLAPYTAGGVMLLMTDGSVVCKSFGGGSTGYGDIFNKLTPDINGSYINGTWSAIAPMHRDRYSFSSLVMNDGRLYAAGGEYGTDGFQAGSHGEVYNPLNDTWTDCIGPGQIMSDGDCKLLDNGTIIQAIVDHFEPTSTVIYTPGTNTYTTGPSTNSGQNESFWMKLPDNSILFVDEGQLTSERYIPSLNQWVADSNVPVELYDLYGYECGPGFLLPDGRGFFIGSSNTTAFYQPSGNTNPGTWTVGPPIPNSGGMPDAPGAMMVNGKILIATSAAPTQSVEFASPTTFYEFDYLTNTYTLVNAPNGQSTIGFPSYYNNMLDLPDGSVLWGNLNGTQQYYVYTPSGSPLTVGKPAIATITQTNCTNFTITGTGFNGISEGSGFGDENQSDSNYPLVRLTSGTNIYYARTFNWNSSGVQRGNLPDTAYFTTPIGIPAGTYSAVVVANGNASDPVTIYVGLPAQPSAITGTSTPCYGSVQTYSIPAVAGALSYVWTTPIGWIGTSTTNSITVTVMNSSGNVTVKAVNVCGNSPIRSLAVTVGHAPVQPGVITGSSSVCAGSTQTYSIAPVTGATSYLWLLPSGWTGTSTTNSITATVGVAGGNVIVRAVNGCGAGPSRTLFVSLNHIPPAPGPITGATTVCSGTPQTYSIAPVVGATSYTWTLPGGWTGSSLTNVINVIVGNSSGNITVSAVNACGSSAASSLAVTVTITPAQPGPISGNTSPCYGSSQTYSVTPVIGATSYVWTIPVGWSGSSTTNSITVTVMNSSGNVTVKAANSCGISPVQTLAVAVVHTPVQPGPISGATSLCAGSTQTYSIASVAGATSYTWVLPGGWSGISTTNSISVTTGNGGGNVIVYANNICGPGPGRNLLVTIINVPNTPGPISGPTNVCQGSVHTYTITPVAGATSYLWSVPTGWIGSSTSTSITVTAGSAGGNISVLSINNCGISVTSRTLAVSVSTGPAQPGPISGATAVCTGSTQTYSIASVTGATSYTWIVPGGWTGSSSLNFITVMIGANGGTIMVSAQNACGSGLSSSLAVTVGTAPSQPGQISGFTTVCQGTMQTYSVSPVAGATSYTWTHPSGWSGTSTSNTISFMVNATSGMISVMAVNNCGSSAAQMLAVNVNPVTPVTISGNPGNYNFCSQIVPTSQILMASSGYISYSWSPSGGSAQTATVSSVNTYVVTATTGAGCTTTASQVVTNNCALPTNLNTMNIMGTSATAMWIQSQCAVNYTIEISVHGLNTWTQYTVVPNNNYVFTGLSLSTTYDWRIQTNCNSSGTINSGWSAIQTFTTAAQRMTEEGNSESAFNLYPNPADVIVTIAFSSMEEGAYSIRLVDMLGRVVKSEISNAGLGENTYTMNLDGIAKGVYMVILQKGDNISKGKLILE